MMHITDNIGSINPKKVFLKGDKVTRIVDKDQIIGEIVGFGRKYKWLVKVNFGSKTPKTCNWWELERLPIK